MKRKLKFIALAALMATSASSFAAMQGATSGNGELLLNLRYYTGAGNAGGDDISAVFDLGVTMNDFLAKRNTVGFNMDWNLRAANYGNAFDTVLAYVDARGGNRADIEYNVIALDNTDSSQLVGGARYLTTFNANAYPSLANGALGAFQGMNDYVTANNARGTHVTQANGASTAVQADSTSAKPVYFGAVNGPAGDTWRNLTGDTTQKVGVAQNFWFLTTAAVDPDDMTFVDDATQASKTAFGFGNEFGKWSFAVNGASAPTGMLAFANPVPEPETYAMLLAGLGLMGAIARRRNKSA
jgi:hypothetical protein